MTPRQSLLRELARKNDAKIVLLVLDGLGGIHTPQSPQTALERASTRPMRSRRSINRFLPDAVVSFWT